MSDNMALKSEGSLTKNLQPCEFGLSPCSVAVQLRVLVLCYTKFGLCEFAETNSQARRINLLVETGCSVAVTASFIQEERSMVKI